MIRNGVIVVLSLLAAGLFQAQAADLFQLPAGRYIIDEIRIDAKKNSQIPPELIEAIQDIKNQTYFELDTTKRHLLRYSLNEPHELTVDAGKQQIDDEGTIFRIGPFTRGRQQLIQQDACGWFDCQAVVYLKRVADGDTRLQQIQQYQIAERKQQIADSEQAAAEWQKLGVHEFEGTLFTENTISIKLPPDLHLSQQQTGIYYRWFDKVRVNLEQPDTLIYSAKYQQISLSLIAVKSERSQFNLPAYLKEQTNLPEAVFFREAHGAAFISSQGRVEAIYSHYDEKNRVWLFATATAENEDQLVDLNRAYAILRTIDPANQGAMIDIRATAALTPTQFQQQYGALNNPQRYETPLRDAITYLLQFETLLRGANSRRFMLDNDVFSNNQVWALPDSIANAQQSLIKAMQTPDEDGDTMHVVYQDKHVLLFQDDQTPAFYLSYYFIEDNGLAYQIVNGISPNETPWIDHLRFINAMRQLPLFKLNTYPAALINSQVGKYYDVKQYDDLPGGRQHYFVIHRDNNEGGVIDRAGRTIIPAVYQDIQPSGPGYIVEDKQDHRGLYDLDGKQILAPADQEISYLQGNQYLVRQSTKQNVHRTGMYDLEQKHWVYPVTYTNITPLKNRADRFIVESVIPETIKVSEQATSYETMSSLGDQNGRLIIPAQFSGISEYNEQVLIVWQTENSDTRYGAITPDGKTIMPVEYDRFWPNDHTLQFYKQGKVYPLPAGF